MRTYSEIRQHPEDFNVRYRLYPESDGGRKVTYQHLRCDFSYEDEDPAVEGIYMIHPEFLDDVGTPIPDGVPVSLVGTASMWILFPEMRDKVHRVKLTIGTKGYFMEGLRKIGEVEVISVVGLHTNPSQNN